MAIIQNWKKRFGRKSGGIIKSYIRIGSMWYQGDKLVKLDFTVFNSRDDKELTITFLEDDLKQIDECIKAKIE